MLQTYNDLQSMDQINALVLPDYNLRTLCWYNRIALENGIDPEAPEDLIQSHKQDVPKQEMRKMSTQEYMVWRAEEKMKETSE